MYRAFGLWPRTQARTWSRACTDLCWNHTFSKERLRPPLTVWNSCLTRIGFVILPPPDNLGVRFPPQWRGRRQRFTRRFRKGMDPPWAPPALWAASDRGMVGPGEGQERQNRRGANWRVKGERARIFVACACIRAQGHKKRALYWRRKYVKHTPPLPTALVARKPRSPPRLVHLFACTAHFFIASNVGLPLVGRLRTFARPLVRRATLIAEKNTWLSSCTPSVLSPRDASPLISPSPNPQDVIPQVDAREDQAPPLGRGEQRHDRERR